MYGDEVERFCGLVVECSYDYAIPLIGLFVFKEKRRRVTRGVFRLGKLPNGLRGLYTPWFVWYWGFNRSC